MTGRQTEDTPEDSYDIYNVFVRVGLLFVSLVLLVFNYWSIPIKYRMDKLATQWCVKVYVKTSLLFVGDWIPGFSWHRSYFLLIFLSLFFILILPVSLKDSES